MWNHAENSMKKLKRSISVFSLELLSRILKSLIKVGYPSRFKSFLSDFLQGDSPCSCGHFEMRLNTVGPLVPEL